MIISCLKGALFDGALPSDQDLARSLDLELGERTIRQIRLDHGLNRWHVAAWLAARSTHHQRDEEDEEYTLCYTPFAGLWLLIPLILSSALTQAVSWLKMPANTTVSAWQLVLTLLSGSVLGFKRIFHLEDFRHRSHLGWALFTGRFRLLSDSTVWRLVHRLKQEAIDAFYHATAAGSIDPKDPQSAKVVSFDDHVVPSFTKLKPAPLAKTRVATRGRSYPAHRMYYHFDLFKEQFIGLAVKAGRLSQVLLELIAEVRELKRLSGHPDPEKLRIIFDRGGYKGSLFHELTQDPDLTFITLAIGYPNSVKQWEAIPKAAFKPYQPNGEKNKNPNLWIAESTTQVRDCEQPLRSVVIRDDTPETKQKWRVIFTDDTQNDPEALDVEYRSRQRHEDSYSELKYGLAGDQLPKAYRLVRVENGDGERRKTVGTEYSEATRKDVQLLGWIKGLGYNLVKEFGGCLGGEYGKMRVGTLVRKFIARPGRLRIEGEELWVRLEPFKEAGVLEPWLRRINEEGVKIPWLGDLELKIEVAPQPLGNERRIGQLRERIFAKLELQKVV